MARRTPEVDRIETALMHLGPVTMRPMFSGWGVFLDGAMFALVHHERLFLKTDDRNIGAFEAAGLEPFSFVRQGQTIVTSLRRAPEPLEDGDMLEPWLQGAYDAAQRAAARKRPKPPRMRPEP